MCTVPGNGGGCQVRKLPPQFVPVLNAHALFLARGRCLVRKLPHTLLNVHCSWQWGWVSGEEAATHFVPVLNVHSMITFACA